MTHVYGKENVTEMIYRLKARLALANFKREYGYEKYDLNTLETNLLSKRDKEKYYPQQQKGRHRYYPTSSTSSINKRSYHRRRASYPILYSFLLSQCPLSAKRSTSPKSIPTTTTFPIEDEDAAHLLVMLHNRN
ncbi:uncharacterized protein BX664DRAFT_297276 [Halteromyces radiatus]|uniref:uncharacterized protein n=1 Tax=Halteromyces radiatus TaxID=101107 RepID=UPI0022206458|nr:uncharacterized protein BX664DRAFT_297276 [Halteromyces radiatus]KAI8089501.1 hypothetical protein BX664DRAFT_297276 [Halteromyces radiatus]